MKGRRIRNFAALLEAAHQQRSVIADSTYLVKPKPAAFLLSQQARIVHMQILAGLWIYEPKKRKAFTNYE